LCPIETFYRTLSSFPHPVLSNRDPLSDTFLVPAPSFVQLRPPIGHFHRSRTKFCPIETLYRTLSSFPHPVLSNRDLLSDTFIVPAPSFVQLRPSIGHFPPSRTQFCPIETSNRTLSSFPHPVLSNRDLLSDTFLVPAPSFVQ
jgi:hypothetical protein